MRQLESMDSEKYSGTPTNDDNGKKTMEVIRMDEEQIVVEIKVSDDFENYYIVYNGIQMIFSIIRHLIIYNFV